jgi:tRNA G37 N-methylase Trm5
MVEVLKSMEIVEIPERGGVLAVDLERVERLVTASVARCLEHRQRAVGKSHQNSARVIYPDRFDLAGQVVFALLDEGFGHRRDFADRAVEPQRRVDAVRQEIAGNAAAGHVDVEPPKPFPTLRQIL